MTHYLAKAGVLAGAVSVSLMGTTALAADLTVGIAGDLRSAIPAGSTADASLTMQQHAYEGLVTWKENGDVAPMLAVDLPEVSEDGTAYVFQIRGGVTFHDGTPLSADSVVGSWTHLLDEATGWPCRQYFNGSGSVEVASIEATGDMEVSFTLAQPAPAFLAQMARADCGEGGIMAPAVYADGETSKPIGTGPFMFDEIVPGQRTVLVPFPDYAARDEPMDGYAGKKEALVDKLTFMVIPDPAANFSALMAGETDFWAAINLSYAEQIEAKEGFTVDTIAIPSINTMAFQTASGPLANAALRRAVSYAIDRGGMVQAISQGYAQPSSSIIPASSDFFKPEFADVFAYDPAEVEEMKKEAGYDGEEIVVTTNKNYASMYETGVMVHAFLQAAGFNAKIEVMDFATQLPKYYSGDYQMMTWNYAPTLDPALILDRVTGSKEATASKIWDTDKGRELVGKLLATPVADRQPVYDEIQAQFAEDAPMLIWSSAQATDAYSDKVEGFSTWVGRKPRFWGVTVAE
ncbi:ABC transporter substrate-binding protein [Maritimibacter alkaliphilus]|uniref:ABC transporter substrate-binding protein n=1 Tax=Maritimibacter alkaliphilus TaxID=404236 RepID=UPI001C98B453|nr:ABC transporter substrate-binding protein [Maritimibacter alkaliphilus]MBY6089953.1 hypothetical protein [Maritimibacter alkaliphilus]